MNDENIQMPRSLLLRVYLTLLDASQHGVIFPDQELIGDLIKLHPELDESEKV